MNTNSRQLRIRAGLSRTGLLAAVLLLGLLGFAGWYFSNPSEAPAPVEPARIPVVPDPPVPDPRLTFSSPFRNIKPGVKYVGDASCASCHPKIDKDYHAHPMGRSAEWTNAASSVEKYDAQRQNPFRYDQATYTVDRDGTKVKHRLSIEAAAALGIPDYSMLADITLGSGTQGRSYLSCEGGSVWQTPISWFVQDNRWDLSPGYDMLNGGRRAVVAECLFCHVNQVEPVAGSLNRFTEPVLIGQAAIGCERCHGPAELHVKERTDAVPYQGIDTSIVNPKHLSAELRQDICRQCHLQGEARIERRGLSHFDYRPGLPWELYVTTVQRHPQLSDFRKSVGQFEQMEKSRCFTASEGKLTCVSCHDPHRKAAPADTASHYNQKCMTCHQEQGCSAPEPTRLKEANSCIACHMAKSDSSSIVHAAVHDHRIPRFKGMMSPKVAGPRMMLPVELYRAGPHAPSAQERDRDLAIALARLARNFGPQGGLSLTGEVDRRLEESLKLWPGDPVLWRARAAAKLGLNDWKAAQEAAENALTLTPQSEEARNQLATATLELGQLDRSLQTARELIRLSPRNIEYRLAEAEVYLRQQNWNELLRVADEIDRIDPLYPKALLMKAVALHHRGEPQKASQYVEVAVSILKNPLMRSQFREWYHFQTRDAK